MKKIKFSLFALLILILSAQAGNPERKKFVTGKDPFGTRVFIENKGQYDNDLKGADKVYYAYMTEHEKIYFTETGLVHLLVKTFDEKEKDREAKESGEAVSYRQPEVYQVHMNWLNPNSNIQIESSEKQSHYFSYWKAELISNTYKKITYKNVYDGIDIEYVIPEDKEQGVKYTAVIHPGADPSKIKIAYTGDVQKLKVLENGDVLIKTPLEDLVEHFPLSFNENKEKVNSKFILKDNILSFDLPEGYESSKTLYIDPWVTAVTSFTNNQSAYDVDYDDNGNVYIYGGDNPYKVAMYNTSGVLVWTFAGTLTTPSWVPTLASNFVVVKSTGKCYIGQGINSTGTRIIRLDAAGVYDNLITPGTATFKEIWDMAYHCSTGNVYGMGGSTGSNQSAGIVDQITGNMVPINFIGPFSTTVTAHDVASHCIDDAGEFFWIYASVSSASLSNHIAKINSAFTTTLWVAASGYTTLSEAANKGIYNPAVNSSNGYNCLAVNNSFLYYYDGKNLAAYDKTTGAQVGSTLFSSHVAKKYGGIAVDDCDNIYFGAQDTIKSMHFNGTSFSPLPHILTNTGASNSAVYDIRLDRVNKLLYVSGRGFVGVYPASNTTTCSPLSIICYNTSSQQFVICAGESVSFTVANVLNLTGVSYSLNPGPITSNTGTFMVTPSVTTHYTAYVTGTNTNNIILTTTTAINVTVNPQPISVPSITQASCTSPLNGFNLNLTFNPSTAAPSYTINWSPIPAGILSNQQTSVVAGNISPGVYNATITTADGCKAYPSFTMNLVEPADFTITPVAPYVLNCYQPTISLNFNPSILSYTTNNNLYAPTIGTTAVFSSTYSSGTWTTTAVHPNSGCVFTRTFTIGSDFTAPSSTLSTLIQNITCSNTAITPVIAIANPSVNVIHYWYGSMGGTVSVASGTSSFLPGYPDVFTHYLVNIANGCGTYKTFTVTSSDGFPTFSVTSPQNFTLGCTTKSVATINIINAQTTPTPGGAVSYTIIGPPTNLSYVTGTLTTYTVAVPGTWTVITKDNSNACETKVQVSVLQNTFTPKINVIVPQQVLSCFVPSIVLEGQSETPNVGYTWSFPGTPGNLVSSTITVNTNTATPTKSVIADYTLTIVDNSSTCKSTSVVPMGQNIYTPNANIAASTGSITCNTETVTLTNNSSTGIPPNTYPSGSPVVAVLWQGPTPQDPLQLSSTYVGAVPGIYTMTAQDLNNGCLSVATKSIADFKEYPNVNKPTGVTNATLDCGETKKLISPILDPPDAAFTYTWITPPGSTVTGVNSPSLTIDESGLYQVMVENSKNGCASFGVVNVVDGKLFGDFTADKYSGYAPLEVTFTNKSQSSLDTSFIKSAWNFGNGSFTINKFVAEKPYTTYAAPGTYTVTMFVNKGGCLDTVIKYIKVEIPSSLVVPNIFTPNGDGVNDLFFLKASNQREIKMTVVDRWGKTVYDVTSTTGNIEWDGTNQQGKESADGIYTYTLKTVGTDGVEKNLKGTITLVR